MVRFISDSATAQRSVEDADIHLYLVDPVSRLIVKGRFTFAATGGP
jgi:response regulator RpfG family c-di-GMP phosphodiesterase